MRTRGFLALLLGTAAVVATVAPGSAGAATPAAAGSLSSARQSAITDRVTVHGFAYDTRHHGASVPVKFYVGGHYAGRTVANRTSPSAVTRRHVAGKHGYSFSFRAARTVTSVTARAVIGGHRVTIGTHAVTRPAHNRAQQIIAVAKRYVGKARYTEGGTSPQHGFDCSGYTRYVYRVAGVARLPHNADAQRHVKGMHRISAAHARPGDLVFYLAGGHAYHVAVYAGHHMQYAAATPRDGIRYQRVWSSAVEYRTLTH